MKPNYKMTLALITIVIAVIGSTVEAGITTKTIAYEDQGQTLQGYLAYDDAVKGRRPAILVVHEWWGLNDYVRKRVDQLADLGYVAFAPDMYGKGRRKARFYQSGRRQEGHGALGVQRLGRSPLVGRHETFFRSNLLGPVITLTCCRKKPISPIRQSISRKFPKPLHPCKA